MLKRKEELEIERRNFSEDTLNIYLFNEGGFYRAYNISALLIHKNNNDIGPQLKKMESCGEIVMYCGFPTGHMDSFTKFLPNVHILSKEELPEDKGSFIIPLSDEFPFSVEDIRNGYKETLDGLPLEEPKKKPKKEKEEKSQAHISPFTFVPPVISGGDGVGLLSKVFSLFGTLAAYNPKNNTPEENIRFIEQTKADLLKILL